MNKITLFAILALLLITVVIADISQEEYNALSTRTPADFFTTSMSGMSVEKCADYALKGNMAIYSINKGMPVGSTGSRIDALRELRDRIISRTEEFISCSEGRTILQTQQGDTQQTIVSSTPTLDDLTESMKDWWTLWMNNLGDPSKNCNLFKSKIDDLRTNLNSFDELLSSTPEPSALAISITSAMRETLDELTNMFKESYPDGCTAISSEEEQQDQTEQPPTAPTGLPPQAFLSPQGFVSCTCEGPLQGQKYSTGTGSTRKMVAGNAVGIKCSFQQLSITPGSEGANIVSFIEPIPLANNLQSATPYTFNYHEAELGTKEHICGCNDLSTALEGLLKDPKITLMSTENLLSRGYSYIPASYDEYTAHDDAVYQDKSKFKEGESRSTGRKVFEQKIGRALAQVQSTPCEKETGFLQTPLREAQPLNLLEDVEYASVDIDWAREVRIPEEWEGKTIPLPIIKTIEKDAVKSELACRMPEPLKVSQKIEILMGLDQNDDLKVYFSEVPADSVYTIEFYKESSSGLAEVARKDGRLTKNEIIINQNALPDFDTINVLVVARTEEGNWLTGGAVVSLANLITGFLTATQAKPKHEIVGESTFSLKKVKLDETVIPSPLANSLNDLANKRREIRALHTQYLADERKEATLRTTAEKYEASLFSFIESLKNAGVCDLTGMFKALLGSSNIDLNNIALDIINYVNELPITLVNELNIVINTEGFLNYLSSIDFPLSHTNIIINDIFEKAGRRTSIYGSVDNQHRRDLLIAAKEIKCDYLAQAQEYLNKLNDPSFYEGDKRSRNFDVTEEFVTALEGASKTLASTPLTGQTEKIHQNIVSTIKSYLSSNIQPELQEKLIENLGRIGTEQATKAITDFKVTTPKLSLNIQNKLQNVLISSGNLNALLDSYEQDIPNFANGFDLAIINSVKKCELDKINEALTKILGKTYKTERILLNLIIDALPSCIERIKTQEIQQITILNTLNKLFVKDFLKEKIINLLAQINNQRTKEMLGLFLLDQTLHDNYAQKIRTILNILEDKKTTLSTQTTFTCVLRDPLTGEIELSREIQEKVLKYLNEHRTVLTLYRTSQSGKLYDQLADLEDSFVEEVKPFDNCLKQKIIKTLEQSPSAGLMPALKLKSALTPQEINTLWPKLDEREKKRLLEINPVTEQNIPYALTKDELLRLLEKK